MTVWRQEWNAGDRLRLLPFIFVAAIVSLASPSPAAAQATTQRVVINRVSGYAISGFDPVAYFVRGKPAEGQSPYELVHDRALWRFRNEGNLNAFRHHPEIYTPLFGGYDPLTVAEGKAIEGRPQIWAIVDNRLMLFSSEENRDTLLKNSRSWLAAAMQRWPALRQELAP